MTEYLFVYGTLLAKAGNEMSHFLKLNAELTGSGYFHGRLYNAGEYPGAVLSNNNNDKVYGNIYSINNPPKVFKMVDAYEETGSNHPEPNEYKRQQITAVLNGQTELTCWVYLYNHPTDDLEQILSGDYQEFISKEL